MKKLALSTLVFLFAATALFADGYEVGDKATDFKLLNVDGKIISMSEMDEAKGIILIFTCNHCPYSKLYEDRILELDRKYKMNGYPVVAVNPNDSIRQPEDSYSKMKERAQEKGFTFPYLLDADQSIAKTYGASRTPHVFLLEKEGNDFIVKYIGAIDDNSQDPKEVKDKFVENAIHSLFKGEEPATTFTKAIGCSIKWASAE